MTLSDFSRLKEYVISAVVISDKHNDLLHALKELFKEDINSVRRFEKINKLSQLLQVLELRGVLSEDNVEVLKTIAKKVNSNDLILEIKKYEDCHVPREYGKYYESERGSKSFLSETHFNANPYESNSMKTKKEIIFTTVVEEIGTYWKDLARTLGIREHFIDSIDGKNRTLATKAKKMMEEYERRADKQKWFFVLCESLDNIHRRDLSKNLQRIMMMNI